MPGIVGIIGKGLHGKYESDLKLMLDCMMHEPFYRRGSYTNEKLGVYVGWTCHPNSYADCMPAINDRKDVVLIFSGEHFPDHPVGDQFKSHGLLRQYEVKGEEFFRDLNGWFSGVLIDFRRSKVILFNDRYGMHRVYYHEEGSLPFRFGGKIPITGTKESSECRHAGLGGTHQLQLCARESNTLFWDFVASRGGFLVMGQEPCNTKRFLL